MVISSCNDIPNDYEKLPPQQRFPLSVAIITKDEEYRLPDCLKSVSFAAEIIVVDSGSTDATVEIAKRFGAVVYSEPWRGFGRQKQSAIDHCTQPWILLLDADERVTPELSAAIQTLIVGHSSFLSYSIPRKNIFCGQWLKHAGWWPDRVVRLFKKGSARMSDRLVHEALEVDGQIGVFSDPLLHYSNRDLSQTLEKINHYSSAGAEQLYARGISTSLFKALAHATWAFANNYVFRLGVLDGVPGLVQATTDAVNTLFKYLKLWEMEKISQKCCGQDRSKGNA